MMSERFGKGIRFRKKDLKNDGGRQADALKDKVEEILSKDIYEVIEDCFSKFETTKDKSSTYVLGLFSIVSAAAEHKDFDKLTNNELCKLYNCIAFTLLHTARVVRTSALRLIRNLLKTSEHADAAATSFLPLFLTRYVDLSVSSSSERGHALRVIRRILHLNPLCFPTNVTAALSALSAEGNCFTEGKNQRKDQLWRVALAVLQEVAVLAPEAFITSGGVRASLMAISELNEPRTLEAVLLCVLSLYDVPHLRRRMHFTVQQLCAPFTEFFFSPPVIQPDKDKLAIPEWRDRSKPSGLQAILSMLRSWTGLLGFGSIDVDLANGGHFYSLVETLKVPNLDTRKKILDLLDQLFRLDTTFWTDEISVALKARYRPKDSWKLQAGFVAEEGKDILPSLSRCRMDLVKNHTAMLIYCLVQANLPDALVEVIKTSDSVVSVRATVLLGEFFYLTYHYLPPVCYSTSICLSNLMDNLSESSKGHLAHLQRAVQTSEALGQYQSTKFQPLRIASSYLRHIIFFASSKSDLRAKPPWRLQGRNTARLKGVIKFSRVCLHEDHLSWDWSLVCAALTWPSNSFRNLEDSYYKHFIRNLVNFFKPCKNQFCSYEYGTEKTRCAAIAGCLLVDFLLSCTEGESDRFAVELVDDIKEQLRILVGADSAHDCLFSPSKMTSSACRDYFLLIGRFTQSERGTRMLESCDVLQLLLRLVTTSPHDCYIKLILSTLNFTFDGFPRTIFTRVIACGQEQARHFATQLLRTLLRVWKKYARQTRSTFPSWAINHLIGRLDDKSFRVKRAAEEILDEICDDSEFLTTVMEFHPILSVEETKFSSILIRFLSNPNGYRYLQQSEFLKEEMERWNSSESQSYVTRVELALCEAFSQHQRDENGAYGRVSDAAHVVKDFPVPNHLYGELGKHPDGVEYLRKYGNIQSYSEILDRLDCSTSDSILSIKTALWSLGHLAGASSEGLKLVQSYGDNLWRISRVASSSPVLSLRGVAFYALSLAARTVDGAEVLRRYGWIAVRHDHLERWPVISDEEWEIQPIVEPDDSAPSVYASNRDRTTSQCSDKSVSFADEVDFIESLGVHEEEEDADSVRWDLGSTDTSLSKEESMDQKKVRFFPLRKKANTLPRTTPATPVLHRRTQSLSEPQKPVKFFKAIRDSFRSRKRSTSKNDSISDVSTPEGSASSSFTSSFRERFRFFRSKNSEPTTPILASPETSLPILVETPEYPVPVGSLNTSATGSIPVPLSTSLAERLKQKRSAFFADLEVCEPLSVSMPVPSAMSEYGKRIQMNVGSESESEPEIEKKSPNPKFVLNALNEEVIVARKPSVVEYPRKEKYLHLSRVGSTLSQMKTVQYKTKQVIIEREDASYFMGLCLPTQADLIFPTNEFLNSKPPPLTEEKNEAVDGIEDHLKIACLRCSLKKDDDAKDASQENIEEREMVRKELLSLVAKLGTGIGITAQEEGLLRLKQAFPWCFQDGCFYSDVCHYISTRTYHLRSRRFLQELFIDFTCQ